MVIDRNELLLIDRFARWLPVYNSPRTADGFTRFVYGRFANLILPFYQWHRELTVFRLEH